jgi:hypothetical protein
MSPAPLADDRRSATRPPDHQTSTEWQQPGHPDRTRVLPSGVQPAWPARVVDHQNPVWDLGLAHPSGYFYFDVLDSDHRSPRRKHTDFPSGLLRVVRITILPTLVLVPYTVTVIELPVRVLLTAVRDARIDRVEISISEIEIRGWK